MTHKNKSKRGRRSAPIEITEGSVTVKIYYTPAKVKVGGATRTYDSWTFRAWLGDQLIRKQSTDLGKLSAQARNVAQRIANAQTATLTMSDAQVAEWSTAQEKLKAGALELRRTLSLISVVESHIETLKILRDKATPQEAARQWVDRNRDITPISTTKLVEQFLLAKKGEGCGAKHLYNLKNNLGRFTAHFQCNIGDIYKADIQDWLRNLGRDDLASGAATAASSVSAQTRLHHLRALTNLFNYAIVNGLLPKTWDELDHISVGIIAETEIGTYTPADMEKILRGAMGQIPLKESVQVGPVALRGPHVISDFDRESFKQNIPFIVTGAFGGLRTAERLRLNWSHFNWDTERIHVTGKRTKGKTTRSNSRRLVPIHPALRDWLEPFIPKNSEADVPLVPYGEHAAGERFRLLCLAVGVEPIENGLRHSYISYRCAELNGDKAKVADESGNSVPTINKHYLDLKTPAQAAAWFGIRREVATNITQLKAAV